MPGDSTNSVREDIDPASGSVNVPIYQTSTFGFEKADEVAPAVEGTSGKYVYTRWDNPTTAALEKKLASLEHGEEAAFFSSGMAAISTTVMAFLRKGDHAVSTRDLYGETFKLFSETLPRFGVDTTVVESSDVEHLSKATRKNTKVVYCETPANPTLKVVDIARAAKVARKAGALLMVDSTFASPINQNPLDLGADLVLHSATKYLNGHADVTAGAAVGSKKLVGVVKTMRRTFGGTIDPHASWLVLRGIKTMGVRVRTQNENAAALAEFLSKHRKVKVVNYPGLKSHPGHLVAKKQMRGYGGMMSIELRGTLRDAMDLTERLKVGTLAASLGGVETLVSQPAVMTQHQVSARDRAKSGIPDTLIRISVGIEDEEDLLRDFGRALDSL